MFDSIKNMEVSQSEVDALFKDELTDNTPQEAKKIIEILKPKTQNLEQTLSKLCGQEIRLSNPKGSIEHINYINNKFEKSIILCDFSYNLQKKLDSLIIFDKQEASFLADLLSNPNVKSPSEDFSDLKLNALKEIFNNIVLWFLDILKEYHKNKITYAINNVELATISIYLSRTPTYSKISEFILISFVLNIGDKLEGKLNFLFPLNIIKEIFTMETKDEDIDLLTSTLTGEDTKIVEGQKLTSKPEQSFSEPAFKPIDTEQKQTPQLSNSSIDFLMDVPLKVSAELGRSEMQIKEILQLGPGSVIELDRLAGEPVNLLVNGKLIARGEVVVIDENFGIRITEIISPAERLSKLK